MKKLGWLLGLFLLAQAVPGAAQVQVGLNVHSGGDSFHLAVGDYFHAPPEQVEVVQRRNIPDEESPVVFFIAAQAHVAPGVILDLRAGGLGWAAIAERYSLRANSFYVPARGSFAGTPYENYYRNYRRGGYRMRDADIVNMVNLRFASDYYHKPAEEVIRLRAGGRDFRAIHEKYRPFHRAPSVRERRPEPVRNSRNEGRRHDDRNHRDDDRRDHQGGDRDDRR